MGWLISIQAPETLHPTPMSKHGFGSSTVAPLTNEAQEFLTGAETKLLALQLYATQHQVGAMGRGVPVFGSPL